MQMNVDSGAVRTERLVPGFDDPVHRAQRVYRALLAATAWPGTVRALDTGLAPLPPLSAAALGIALSLFDGDTPVWLDRAADCPPVHDNLRFHCGCPMVNEPVAAAFALIAEPAAMPALDAFQAGDELYPDRAATLIVQVDAFEAGERLTLSGPGIERRITLAVEGLPRGFAASWRANAMMYPAGVDLVLAAGDCLAALPRSTRLEAG